MLTFASIKLIHLYQLLVKPFVKSAGFQCRFTPSCSDYAVLAIQKHGTLKGSVMAVWRILRCNPYNKHFGPDYP